MFLKYRDFIRPKNEYQVKSEIPYSPAASVLPIDNCPFPIKLWKNKNLIAGLETGF